MLCKKDVGVSKFFIFPSFIRDAILPSINAAISSRAENPNIFVILMRLRNFCRNIFLAEY